MAIYARQLHHKILFSLEMIFSSVFSNFLGNALLSSVPPRWTRERRRHSQVHFNRGYLDILGSCHQWECRALSPIWMRDGGFARLPYAHQGRVDFPACRTYISHLAMCVYESSHSRQIGGFVNNTHRLPWVGHLPGLSMLHYDTSLAPWI